MCPTARVKLAVYLGKDTHKIGPGKISLLEEIDRRGSISSAARAMGMAYRHAWELIDDLNACFAAPVLEVEIGGPRGGGAGLTAWGREVVERYRRMETATRAAIRKDLDCLSANTSGANSRMRGGRRSKGAKRDPRTT